MHDRFLTALQTVAHVSLVAALKDDRIGFLNSNDLWIFIPDLHLTSRARRAAADFLVETNCEDLLIQVLGVIKDVRANANAGESVKVVQIGDDLDLWREVPNIAPTENTAQKIDSDYRKLKDALEKLNALMFYGNHDFELYHWPSYAGRFRTIYTPQENPRVLILHGDVFDWMEKLPDSFQDLVVYLLSPGWKPKPRDFSRMRDAVSQTTPDPRNNSYIKLSAPAPVGPLQPAAVAAIPERFNIQRADDAANNELFGPALGKIHEIRRRYNYAINTMVIGHTHHARIVAHEEGGDFFALIDCGAWIESCKDDQGVEQKNAQIGAICGNEARIYQLRRT